MRGLQVLFNDLFNLGFGFYPEYLLNHFSVFEQQQGGDAPYAKLGGGGRVVIDVYFSHQQSVVIFHGNAKIHSK